MMMMMMMMMMSCTSIVKNLKYSIHHTGIKYTYENSFNDHPYVASHCPAYHSSVYLMACVSQLIYLTGALLFTRTYHNRSAY